MMKKTAFFLFISFLSIPAIADEYPDYIKASETCRLRSDVMVIEAKPLSDKVKNELVQKAAKRLDCNFDREPKVMLSREVRYVPGNRLRYVEVSY